MDMSNEIPNVQEFDFLKSKNIEHFLKKNPTSCKNYLLKILRQRNNSKIGEVEFNESKSCISLYIQEYKPNKFTTVLRGYRYFDIIKLSKYLATTRFKVTS